MDLKGAVPVVTVDAERQTALTSQDFTLSEDPLRLREELASFKEWQGGLLVVASLTVHPILLRNVNRICLHHGIPWVHAAADGPYLLVGPTFTPKRSSCYECFESRVAMSMREERELPALQASLSQPRDQARQAPACASLSRPACLAHRARGRQPHGDRQRLHGR